MKIQDGQYCYELENVHISTIKVGDTILDQNRHKNMIVETKLIKTGFEALIESGNREGIMEVMEAKETALKDALENAEFYRSVNNTEFADNEQSRANRLQRDINKLRAAL